MFNSFEKILELAVAWLKKRPLNNASVLFILIAGAIIWLIYSNAQQTFVANQELNKNIEYFSENLAGVDTHIECKDDEGHNTEVRKATTYLSYIESEAIRLKRYEVISKFVNPKKGGIYIIKNCRDDG